MSKEQALVESKALRESYIYRTDVLDKVKRLMLLPDDVNANIEMVATFYEVPRKAIDSLIWDHREEVETDGLRVLSGAELEQFVISFGEKANISRKVRSLTIIPRRAILRIGMLLRDSPVARAVRDKLLDMEDVAREPELLHFRKEAMMLEVTASVLRLPDSGRLKLLGDFNKRHRLDIPLPAYADEPITESATELLRKLGVGISAKALNILLLNRGILEEKERPSSKGGVKTFKSLTDMGLQYGKNIISPNSPRETAPHYYPDKFDDLLKLVGVVC